VDYQPQGNIQDTWQDSRQDIALRFAVLDVAV